MSNLLDQPSQDNPGPNEVHFIGQRPTVIDSGPLGLRDCPGRNDPRWGQWLIATFCEGVVEPVIVDPMCGGGQLWMLRPSGVAVYGCELVESRVYIARANGLTAHAGRAEDWTPPATPDLVAFSPPYPSADHDSGNKGSLVSDKALQSMQAIEQVPCMWRVFAQIATHRARAPVAVIVKNYVRDQAEVDWVSEVAASMTLAGLGEVRRFYRRVPPGPTEQWKLAQGKRSSKTGKLHRVVDLEWVLVAMPGVA